MIHQAIRRAGSVHHAIWRTAGVTAASVLTMAGLALSAAPAHASNPAPIDIDGWVQSACSNDGYLLCLWYHQGHGSGGAGWGTNVSVPTITGTFFLSGSPGNQGLGQAVRNNAGSMSDGDYAGGNCDDFAYVSPNYMGYSNLLYPGLGGNLTNSPQLHNNEASVKILC